MLMPWFCTDQVDTLLGRRPDMEQEGLLSMKAEFLSQWDSMETNAFSRFIIMGATNRPQDLEDAVLDRSGQL